MAEEWEVAAAVAEGLQREAAVAVAERLPINQTVFHQSNSLLGNPLTVPDTYPTVSSGFKALHANTNT